MVRMIGYMKAFLDQCGNTLQGPQVGRVPGPERTFQEILRQPRFLCTGQPRWTPGCGSGMKSLDPVFLVCLAPSYDRTLRGGEQSSDGRHGLSLAQELDGLSAAPFQLLSASLWSHATQCNYNKAYVPLFMRKSIRYGIFFLLRNIKNQSAIKYFIIESIKWYILGGIVLSQLTLFLNIQIGFSVNLLIAILFGLILSRVDMRTFSKRIEHEYSGRSGGLIRL